MAIAECKAGQRIEISPSMDAWMQGDLYGEVVKLGRTRVHVRMDRSNRILRLVPDQIERIVS